MPSPQQSDPSAQPHPGSPTCPKCGTLMRLVWVEPNPNYVNLDMWSYACDCGATANNLVAHIAAA
jgi:uncharacterized protein (UPF0212 family)